MSLKDIITNIIGSKPKKTAASFHFDILDGDPSAIDSSEQCLRINYDPSLTIFDSVHDIDHPPTSGGVIVLKSNIDRMKIGNQSLVYFVNDNIKNVLAENDMKTQWSIGYYMEGEFSGSHGYIFDGDSICVSAHGMAGKDFLTFAALFCKGLNQYGILVKINEQNAVMHLQCD